MSQQQLPKGYLDTDSDAGSRGQLRREAAQGILKTEVLLGSRGKPWWTVVKLGRNAAKPSPWASKID